MLAKTAGTVLIRATAANSREVFLYIVLVFVRPTKILTALLMTFVRDSENAQRIPYQHVETSNKQTTTDFVAVTYETKSEGNAEGEQHFQIQNGKLSNKQAA